MDISLIGVPINYGCDREGAQCGVAKLRDFGITDIIRKNGHTLYDLGDIIVPYISPDDKYKDHKKMKFLNTVIDINTNLAHQVYCSLSGQSFPFTIGGDHSLGLGSIAGGSRFFREMAVIWIDAHGDINDMDTSPSGNIHGMPLAASMGVGYPSLVNLYFEGKKVKPENIYIIGARDLDDGEVRLAKESNLNLYTMDIIRDRGLEEVISELKKKIISSNVDSVHLSFDIDSLDKSIVPGTGTAVDNGFKLEEGKFILESILSEGLVTSMDFVELNPKLDSEDEKTAKLCVDVLEHIFKVLK